MNELYVARNPTTEASQRAKGESGRGGKGERKLKGKEGGNGESGAVRWTWAGAIGRVFSAGWVGGSRDFSAIDGESSDTVVPMSTILLCLLSPTRELARNDRYCDLPHSPADGPSPV